MTTVDLSAYWPLALLAGLPLIWLLARRSRVSVARGRVLAAAALRSAVLIAIVAALMRPVLLRPSDEISVVYALDVSNSVSRAFLGEALAWIERIDAQHRPAQSRIVAFADRPELVDSPQAARALALADQAGAGRDDAIDPGATDLQAGLLAALPAFAPGQAKRVVLVTDGNPTQGDVWQAMQRLQAEGVRVFAYPAASAVDADAWVERIDLAPGTRERAATPVEVVVFSRAAAPARIELTIGERLAAARSVELTAGENRVAFTVQFPGAGVQKVQARVRARGDELARNDTLLEEVVVQPRPRVLYVEGGEREARYLADALGAQGMRVTVASPERLSREAGLLAGTDVVILSDVRAESLSAGAVARVRDFVRDEGGGLIFAAGPNTYGQEGFHKSELERLLPITFEAKRKHEDLDLVLLLDRSSSMRGQKIEVAKSAALATLDLLDPEHRLAVISFDAQPHDIVPLLPVGDKREAENLISRMISSGQTNIYNALARAQALLADSKAKTKHIILLSDGLTAPAPDQSARPFFPPELADRLRELQEQEAALRGQGAVTRRAAAGDAGKTRDFPTIMHDLAQAKVTLSTVAIGERPDTEFLTDLAMRGGGTSYVTRIDAEVPTLFAAEVHRLLNDSIVEEPFRPLVKAKTPALAGVDFAQAPALRGYVAAKPKRVSDVLLEAKQDMPLLAETHYGLGKTVSFTSDVKNRWAADWLTWPGYARFWAQVVRDTLPSTAVGGLTWNVLRAGREARIELSALTPDGGSRIGLAPRVRVTAPDGEVRVVALRQVAPGQYRTGVALGRASDTPWRFELLPGAGVDRDAIVRTGPRALYYSRSDEDRLLPPNVPLLRTLSEQTGGALAPAPDAIFEARGDGGLAAVALWPALAGLALLLFLLDIAVRRVPLPSRRTG
jgi:Mg-chelatase subunit ChlD